MKIEKILKAIEDEPELPGDVPLEMRAAIEGAINCGNIALMVQIMRIIVKQTKQGIRGRVLAVFHKDME
jgi:hypothetical protein